MWLKQVSAYVPSAPRWSPARCAAATAPARAPTPSRCWRAWCVPPANAGSTPARCSRRCCAPAHPSCPKRSRCRHPPDRRRAAPDGSRVRRPSHRAGRNRHARDTRQASWTGGDVFRETPAAVCGVLFARRVPRLRRGQRRRPTATHGMRPPNPTILRQAYPAVAVTSRAQAPFFVTLHGLKPLPDPVTEYEPVRRPKRSIRRPIRPQMTENARPCSRCSRSEGSRRRPSPRTPGPAPPGGSSRSACPDPVPKCNS